MLFFKEESCNSHATCTIVTLIEVVIISNGIRQSMLVRLWYREENVNFTEIQNLSCLVFGMSEYSPEFKLLLKYLFHKWNL